MKVVEALQNLQSLNQDQLKRLEEANLVKNSKISDLGLRILNGNTTQEDLEFFKKKFNEWYCHVPLKPILKSPIDCGHR